MSTDLSIMNCDIVQYLTRNDQNQFLLLTRKYFYVNPGKSIALFESPVQSISIYVSNEALYPLQQSFL